MGWQKVKHAFFVQKKDGQLQHIDIGVCGNCGGIHIPAGEANRCDVELIMTYDEIVAFYKEVHNELRKKMLEKRKRGSEQKAGEKK